MSLASDLAGLGLGVLREVLGTVTGSLVQDGATKAFTGAAITSRRRTPRAGMADVEGIDLNMPASGVAVQPRADSYLTFTGDASHWQVVEVQPVMPGGTVTAWRISLRTDTRRTDDLA